MPLYVVIPLGSNLSTIVNLLQVQNEAMRSFERGTTEPTVKPIGLLWNCTNGTYLEAAGTPEGVTEALLRWNGTAWTFLLAIAGGGGGGGGVILANGSVPFEADQSMGGNKLIDVGTAEEAGDALPWEQGLHLDAGGDYFDADGVAIKNLAAPVDPDDAVRLQDIADSIGQAWFGGNRHGTPSHVVARDTDINLGFTPRRLEVKLYGRGHNVSGGSSNGGRIDTTLVFNRWDADGTGGYAGTASSQTLNAADLDGVFPGGIDVTVTWLTGGTKGFKIQFFGGIGGAALHLRNPSNSAVDGSWQMIATNDPEGN